jgi:hypothetical protein
MDREQMSLLNSLMSSSEIMPLAKKLFSEFWR